MYKLIKEYEKKLKEIKFLLLFFKASKQQKVDLLEEKERIENFLEQDVIREIREESTIQKLSLIFGLSILAAGVIIINKQNDIIESLETEAQENKSSTDKPTIPPEYEIIGEAIPIPQHQLIVPITPANE